MNTLPYDIIVDEICTRLSPRDIKNLISSKVVIVHRSFWEDLSKKNYGQYLKYRRNRSWESFYINIIPMFSPYVDSRWGWRIHGIGDTFVNLVKEELTQRVVTSLSHDQNRVTGYLLVNKMMFEGRTWEDGILRMNEKYKVIEFALERIVDDNTWFYSSDDNCYSSLFLDDVIDSIHEVLFNENHLYHVQKYEIVKLSV